MREDVDRLHPHGCMMSTPSPRVNQPLSRRFLRRTNRPSPAVGCPLSERRSHARTLATSTHLSKPLSTRELSPTRRGTLVPLATVSRPPSTVHRLPHWILSSATSGTPRES